MNRVAFPLVVAVASMAASLALACADIGCTTHWAVSQTTYGECNNLPFLSPGNDTRVNLQLLMQDESPRQVLPGALKETTDKSTIETAVFSLSDLTTVLNPRWGPPPAAPAPGAADKATSSPPLAEGEGSRCVSSDRGRADFVAAVRAAAGLSAAERDQLLKARESWTPDCAGGAAAKAQGALASLKSRAAQPFADYLRGAASFYDGDFDAALAAFRSLQTAPDPWLRESAAYMTGRGLLNKAEVGAFAAEDGQARPKVKDAAALAAAETALRAYLKQYPAGRYAASARGLIRRLYWLGGDGLRLSGEYDWLLRHGADPLNNLDGPTLVEEIDAKFLAAPDARTHSPVLLAALDLLKMRKSDGDKPPAFPAADLESQAADFKGRGALFSYLKAARAFYVDADPKGALQALGAADAGALATYLAFSRETLRGEALTALKDAAASQHWIALIPRGSQPWQRETAELGLALTYQQEGAINKVFMPGSPVAAPRIREILLRTMAGPILLRQAAEAPAAAPRERDLARWILLYKEATRGRYEGFLKDAAAPLPPAPGEGGPYLGDKINLGVFNWRGEQGPYPCGPLKAAIAALAANPGDPRALLCLGDFIRVFGLEGFELDAQPPPQELGGAKSIFPGAPLARGEIYKSLIADARTPGTERAYALFRAINCYGPSGHNGCGGKDVPLEQRKAWFQTLKTSYGQTPFAQSLKYFW